MTRNMICIECPKGCNLSVDIENCKVISVKGAKCPKGTGYAISETEEPARILTATVRTEGLALKLVPVRTNKPIPKKDLQKAMQEIKKIKITNPIKAGDVIVENFLGIPVKLLATREAGR
jgi:CxxC motif-containing protein